MDLDRYQDEAQHTDRFPNDHATDADRSLIVPLLGLAGEAGGLLSEYKKYLRDGPAHKFFEERVEEELGDILWYVANIATKFDLKLNGVAQSNLKKIKDRWGPEITGASPTIPQPYDYDSAFPAKEQFPRQMDVELCVATNGSPNVIELHVNGERRGDVLTDNAYAPDGYAFHDVFHFAHAAVLGWSPALRKLLKCKRKSDAKVDEVEDGARARVIEEGLAAIVFDYARSHNFFDGVQYVDYEMLRTLRGAAQHLEVKRCSLADWQSAILQGYAVWRAISATHGGRFQVDLDAQRITLAI